VFWYLSQRSTEVAPAEWISIRISLVIVPNKALCSIVQKRMVKVLKERGLVAEAGQLHRRHHKRSS